MFFLQLYVKGWECQRVVSNGPGFSPDMRDDWDQFATAFILAKQEKVQTHVVFWCILLRCPEKTDPCTLCMKTLTTLNENSVWTSPSLPLPMLGKLWTQTIYPGGPHWWWISNVSVWFWPIFCWIKIFQCVGWKSNLPCVSKVVSKLGATKSQGPSSFSSAKSAMLPYPSF